MAMTIEQLLEMVETLAKRVDELEKLNGVVAQPLEEKKGGKKEKKEKKEKKPVDPNKPKKTSGYLIYSNSVRAEVKEQLIAGGGEGKPKEVVQAIAAKWKELGDEEKAVWNEKAKTPPASEDEDA
jgi:inorganic triphosphatase YgiF